MADEPQQPVLEAYSFLGAIGGYVARGIAGGAIVGAVVAGIANRIMPRGQARSLPKWAAAAGVAGALVGFVKASNDLARWSDRVEAGDAAPNSPEGPAR